MDTVSVVSEKKVRSPWTQAVAAQIRAERAARGLTQQAVMDLAGFAKSTYLRMESGERVVDSDQVAQLCAAYNMRVSTFFARAEERMVDGAAPDRGDLGALADHLVASVGDPEVDAMRETLRKRKSQ